MLLKTIPKKIFDFFRNFNQKEIKILLTLLLIVFGLWIFLAIAGAVSEGKTSAFDEYILLAFRDSKNPTIPLGSEQITSVIRDITSLGSAAVISLLTSAVFLFLLLSKEKQSAILVAGATIGGVIIITVLKIFFARERPDIVPHLTSEKTLSFPSGHSAISAVVYLSLASLTARIQKKNVIRIFIISVALIITFLVGLSRIYLGVHYPTDVLAGWSLGLAWAALYVFVARIFEKRASPKQE